MFAKKGGSVLKSEWKNLEWNCFTLRSNLKKPWNGPWQGEKNKLVMYEWPVRIYSFKVFFPIGISKVMKLSIWNFKYCNYISLVSQIESIAYIINYQSLRYTVHYLIMQRRTSGKLKIIHLWLERCIGDGFTSIRFLPTSTHKKLKFSLVSDSIYL